MGALVRSLDGSRTALGPLQRWPQSLRTIVSTCLSSRFASVGIAAAQLPRVFDRFHRIEGTRSRNLAADGTVDAIMVVAFEVTERARSAHEQERLIEATEGLHAERERLLLREREARAYAEHASLEKDEFLAMLGHELRNPLAPIVMALELRIAQVISNLLTNAAKYTEPGGRLVVSAQARDGGVELCVADNGIGISEETLPHVFELFTQERQAIDRARGGLGPGLAIAQNLMVMHSGSVAAASEGRGAGSTFTIRLSSAIAPSAEPVNESNASQRSMPAASAMRVLIVDDNADAAEMLGLAMNELGRDIRIGYDGASALQIVESFEPQPAVLDIGLPVMDGYELAQHLRQRAGVATLRLVALTGYGQKSDIERALQAGFDEHIIKPIDLGSLGELLARSIADTQSASSLRPG